MLFQTCELLWDTYNEKYHSHTRISSDILENDVIITSFLILATPLSLLLKFSIGVLIVIFDENTTNC